MPRKSSLLIIFLVVFIDLVGFGIVIPILPYYAKEFGASAWQLGWLMTSFSLMQFLFAPVWGRISDHVGRRPVLLVSVLGTALSMALLAWAPSLAWLFVGRLLAGICGANISTAYAYITDVTSEKDRAKGMGMVGAAFGLGFIFGPAIGGVLSAHGYAVPMLAGAGLALFNFVFAFFKLEEPRLSAAERSAHRSKRFDFASIRKVLSQKQTAVAILAFLLVTFAVTQLEVTFALFMGERYGYDATQAGALLAVMGIVMVGIQGGLIGKLARRFGERQLVLFGTIVCAAALVSFALATNVPWMVTSLVVLALGHGLLHPSLSSLASMGAPSSRSGATMGVFQSAGSLARVLGPPCAGFLYDRIGMGSPFHFGAGVLGVAAAIALTGLQKTR